MVLWLEDSRVYGRASLESSQVSMSQPQNQRTDHFILAEDDPRLSTILIGYLMFSRGLGNILSTPISTALSHPYSDTGFYRQRLGFKVGGGRFEDIIIYAGTCFAGAALISAIGWGLEMRKKSLTS